MKRSASFAAWSAGRAISALFCLVLAASLSAQSAAPGLDQSSDQPVVKMQAFQVTADIATYHQETSMMATKIPMDVKELSSSLQILNSTAITDRNALSLPDIYGYLVGAVQTQQSINGFTFRGFPNTGTFTQNIETDGLMGQTLKKGASSAADVDRLEFLKGPNSVLYGQMHPGGLLNIITKSPEEIPATTVRTSVGTYAGKYSTFGDKTLGDVTLDTTGPLGRSRHLFYRLVVDASDSPPSRPGDSDRLLSIFPSFTYRWSPKTSLTMKFESSQDRRRQDDGLVPNFTNGIADGENAQFFTAPLNTVYQEPSDTGRDRGAAAAMSFHTAAGPWSFRLRTRSVWHTDYNHELSVNSKSVYFPKAQFATPGTTLKREYLLQINGHRYNYFDANAYRKFGPASFTNTVLIGVGGGAEFSDNQRYAFGPNVSIPITLIDPILGQSPYPPDGTKALSSVNSITSLGEYVSDQMKIADRLHVSVAARHDRQLTHGQNIFPATVYATQTVRSVTGQFGVVYDLTKSLSAYASWSQSVLPNAVTHVDASGESNLPPEKGLQYEGGLKFETPNHTFYGTIDGYFINRSNVEVATGRTFPATGEAIWRVDGEQHSEGVEIDAQWHPVPYWQVQAGTALGKAFIAASEKLPQTVGMDLINAPRVTANLWTRYKIPTGSLKGLGFGLGVVYVGKQWAGGPGTPIYFVLPAWTRVDAAAYYKWRRYEFYLNISNLLDKQYISSSQSSLTLNPGEARKITFAVITKF